MLELTFLWIILSSPLALITAGLLPAAMAGQAVATRIQLARFAAYWSLAMALGSAAAVALDGTIHTPALGVAGLGLAVYLDALSAAMFCLVSFIGVIVVSYSDRYLAGDPRHAHFIRTLSFTLGSVLLLIVSGNLLQFALAWIATSMGLHELLIFYPERQAALLAARKKYLASRLGDISLFGAMALLYHTLGSLDYASLFASAEQLRNVPIPLAVHCAALLLVLTGLLKS